VDGYSGDGFNALAESLNEAEIANGMMFSTPDQDNDIYPAGVCAVNSGWWYGWCTTSCINSDINTLFFIRHDGHDVLLSRMLVKLN